MESMTEPQIAPAAGVREHIAATKYWYDAADERRIERDQLRKKLKAITEATILWRDRTAGDIGLAIALAGILDTEAPEPPATAALARVRKLHRSITHLGQKWCAECSVRRSTGPRDEEWVAFIPHPCPTLDALAGPQ
jgi:hypothetical protein